MVKSEMVVLTVREKRLVQAGAEALVIEREREN
jgi:hypothetical protein